MYSLIFVFLFVAGVSTQWTSFMNQERNEKKIGLASGNIFFLGPTYRPSIRYREFTTTTTTLKPRIANYIRPREYGEYEEFEEDGEYDDGASCVLSSTPPDPGSQCCGIDASTRNRVVGGDPTRIDEYPWLVQIEYYNSTQNVFVKLCGGFLISGRYALSAAHCFVGEVLKRGQPANVVVGDYDIKNDGPDCVNTPNGRLCTDGAMTVPIEDYIVHPKYLNQQTSIVNDITIVRLSKTVEYSTFVRPLCLPTYDITATSRNLRFYVAGWGAVKDRLFQERGSGISRHQYVYDDIKRDVDVPFVGREKCSRMYTFLNQGHICAGGERGKDSCNSDSGSPLMYQGHSIYEAVGIVSTGLKKYACGTEDRPAVYTKVYPYLSWIRNNIKP